MRNKASGRAVVALLALLAASLLAGLVVADNADSRKKERRAHGVSALANTATLETQPNILYLLLDDANTQNMNEAMLETAAMVRDRGANFTNFYLANPLCCPSRAAGLTGMYSHHNGVMNNFPPNGGYDTFQNRGHNGRTIGRALDAMGYATGIHGKYLNGYNPEDNFVPGGWDDWFVKVEHRYYNWEAINSKGKRPRFGTGPNSYADTVVMNRAGNWFLNQENSFFEYLSPHAPHGPYLNPPGEEETLPEFVPSEAPSYNEADTSDKPKYVADNPSLDSRNDAAIADRYAKTWRMTRHVDQAFAEQLRRLEATGELENTYVVVTSDNGFMSGEHRINGKRVPYEESASVPLWISGPGIEPGTVVEEPASNVDLFATFTDMASQGSETQLRDGRSLLPLAQGGAFERKRAFFEGTNKASSKNSPNKTPGYDAMYDISLGTQYKYVRYVTGERELYDLDADPYEMNNLLKTDPEGSQVIRDDLEAKLNSMNACSGESCRIADS